MFSDEGVSWNLNERPQNEAIMALIHRKNIDSRLNATTRIRLNKYERFGKKDHEIRIGIRHTSNPNARFHQVRIRDWVRSSMRHVENPYFDHGVRSLSHADVLKISIMKETVL